MGKASIHDVAREAGVSITSVSRALNAYDDVSEARRKRIKEVVERLNYAPNDNARSLGGKANKVLALLVSGLHPGGDNGFVFGMLSGLYQVTLKYNYEFILLTTNAAKQKEMNYLQLCRQKNIEGVMISGIKTDDPYYTELANSEIPCVIIDAQVDGKYVVSLSIDNTKAAYEAVKYLLDSGHKKIVMINGGSLAAVSKLRYEGYERALLESGIEVKQEYVLSCDFEEEIAYEKTMELVKSHPEVTAFFCASDVMAIGVLNAINSMGKRVPEDYSVIGFDDIPASKYVNGGLSTIHQEPFDMGIVGGEALINMIENNSEASDIIIPYTFLLRKTTRKVN
jgi:LacI family transcriptional regulator